LVSERIIRATPNRPRFNTPDQERSTAASPIGSPCPRASFSFSIEIITQSVVAADGDKQRAAELFVESMEVKGVGWLASIVFRGVVEEVKLGIAGTTSSSPLPSRPSTVNRKH
jgi:hypothetical protein